ncbi:PEGA domain-containing protein [bacterium]|nr:PEGA domain-containing protein [bacterium]
MFFQISKSYVSLLILFFFFWNFIFVHLTFASTNKNENSIAIIPIKDNTNDYETKQLANTLTLALQSATSLNVLSQDTVETALSYYKNNNQASSQPEMQNALIHAKEAYFHFDYEDALIHIKSALKLWNANPEAIYRNGQYLIDTNICAALIYKALNQSVHSRDHFRAILKIDPDYKLDSKIFPPSLVEIFDEESAGLKSKPSGSLKISSDPKVAEVFVNGILKGITPLQLNNLPLGEYYILIQTNKYRPEKFIAEVKDNENYTVNKNLVWIYNENKKAGIKSAATLKAFGLKQVEDGVSFSNLLKVDKILLIDVDQAPSGGGEIIIQMVDRRFRSGHRPILIKFDKNKSFFEENIAKMTKIIAKQAKISLLTLPDEQIEPEIVGDPIILRGRRTLLMKDPVFWGTIGTLITAGIIGGIVAAGGSDSSTPETGSINVNFK